MKLSSLEFLNYTNMIRLNEPRFKDNILKEDVLKYISDYDVFNYYITDLTLNKITHSPLRNDKKPSFGVFWSKKYNMLLFKDQATGDRGDCVIFVSKLYNISHNEALLQIITDFRLGESFGLYNLEYNKKKPIIHNLDNIKNIIKESADIKVKIRDWKEYDILYWKSYGISLKTLKKYRIFPIKYIFINNEIIRADKYAYSFAEVKDNVVKFKIYQPYSVNLKWLNNMVEGTLSGWSQLPKKGNLLIIASSLKDALCLHDIGFKNVIAPQTENYIFKQHIINNLKSRFDKILIFYDYDIAGINAANKMKNLFNIPNITTGIEELKDPSDFYKKQGKNELKKLIIL